MGGIFLGCIIWMSIILASGETLNLRTCQVKNKSYEWCSNCSTYEITINVILCPLSGEIIKDKVYAREPPLCSCDSLSIYPIVTTNLDYFNSIEDIYWCNYDDNYKIYKDSKYAPKLMIVIFLTVGVIIFLVMLFILLFISERPVQQTDPLESVDLLVNSQPSIPDREHAAIE